ncbi:hypothetical protein JK359_27255 [Streptomyces actinomycinicus]|uniref:Secreted protein n=1 Tax=Streptomyces actinomycinicus TaxID=1695166 RepID=A0A937EP38_9ACTN|nr:hypothetical protein [Streptomyces actinomycinicus]MBL1085621.1 hypothetical protein [Streptomyces actinomycinicus]
MPRGRHRHSPPLHRLLPPSAIAGVSVVCALGPWAFSEATVLRALAAAAAATAVVGAVVMRRWDAQAGKQVAELTRARAGDEWRYEERVAELETDLEESRELRAKLEQRLRAKRTELAGLRNEHASLLRRYATAETERASALEGRRLLELESAPEPTSAPALPPARHAGPDGTATGGPEGPRDAGAAEGADGADRAEDLKGSKGSKGSEGTDGSEGSGAAAGRSATEAVFSADGARLYRRALTALARFDRGDAPAEAEAEAEAEGEAEAEAKAETEAEVVDEAEVGAEAVAVAEGQTEGQTEGQAGDEPEVATAPGAEVSGSLVSGAEVGDAQVSGAGVSEAGPAGPEVAEVAGDREMSEAVESAAGAPEAPASEVAEAGADAKGEHATAGVTGTADIASASEAAHASAAAHASEVASAADVTTRAGQTPAGHFTVPTAVAVVPAAPVRRPVVEGGFDFFGTQKGDSKDTLDSVQNEDLADVVGPEALAVHKAEAEAGFKPADAQSQGVGQVIDLTAHDETEQIDVQGLHTAAS